MENWYGSFGSHALASCSPASDRRSNDSLETISAVFPRDRTIRSQTNDRISFRTAGADALPPVAAHSSARHEPQTTKINLFVHMRVSLQDDADVIVQENIDHFCCIGHHERVYQTSHIRSFLQPLSAGDVVYCSRDERHMRDHNHGSCLADLVQIGAEPGTLFVPNFSRPSAIGVEAYRVENDKMPSFVIERVMRRTVPVLKGLPAIFRVRGRNTALRG